MMQAPTVYNTIPICIYQECMSAEGARRSVYNSTYTRVPYIRIQIRDKIAFHIWKAFYDIS